LEAEAGTKLNMPIKSTDPSMREIPLALNCVNCICTPPFFTGDCRYLSLIVTGIDGESPFYDYKHFKATSISIDGWFHKAVLKIPSYSLLL